MSDDLEFPCSTSTESLRFDVYSTHNPDPAANRLFDFTGTVTNRLNVLSDPKQIKEHLKTASGPLAALHPPRPLLASHIRSPEKLALLVLSLSSQSAQMSSLRSGMNPYAVATSDSKQDVATKFLALMALGPLTRAQVEHRLGSKLAVPQAELNDLFAAHTQPYRQNDTFTEDDVYPSLALNATEINPALSYFILKDKAYKELRPWNTPAYTDYERNLIIDNANNALSRLGFLDTHPLRRRIVEKSASDQVAHKKSSSLGGGLLISGRKSTPNNSPLVAHTLAALATSTAPASPLSLGATKKASMDSPKLAVERELESRKPVAAPAKESAKRKYVASLSLSGSSSEDEKHAKRVKKDGKRSDSSGSHNSVNSNATSYTLPSSVNEDAHAEDEQSDDDVKLLSISKTVSSLPSRPQSSASTAEKKQQYYMHLAGKFRVKYQEYEKLHRELSKDHRRGNVAEKKKQLMKLFEMHNTLAEWKRKLWDHHNENSMSEGIMNLSRHRKTGSSSSHQSSIPSSAPASSQLMGHEKFHKANTTSPAVPVPDRFPAKPQHRRSAASDTRTPTKQKIALDY